MLIFLLTVIPGILFSLLFYFLDKNRKKLNIPLLILTFILGGVSSYLCYRLEWHFGSYFKKVAESNLLEVLFYAIFGVAIFEEGLKLFFAFVFSRLNKIKDRFSTIVYCLVASSGFLTAEDLLFYSYKYGLSTTISRLYTANLCHICFSIFMGILLYKCKGFNIKSILYLFLSLAIPTLLHAVSNTFLYQGNVNLYIYSSLYIIILVIISTYLVIKFRFFNNKNDN